MYGTETGVWCQEICRLQSSDKHCPSLPHGNTHMHPRLETRRKKKCMAKILQTFDSQTNISGKEIAVNQVEKMLETGTMAEVHNEAGQWINYRRNKQVMNDAMPSVPKDENSFDAVAIIKRKTDEYDPYYI